eukprot:6179698-Pleurochrysis_carterae.AAC.1
MTRTCDFVSRAYGDSDLAPDTARSGSVGCGATQLTMHASPRSCEIAEQREDASTRAEIEVLGRRTTLHNRHRYLSTRCDQLR